MTSNKPKAYPIRADFWQSNDEPKLLQAIGKKIGLEKKKQTLTGRYRYNTSAVIRYAIHFTAQFYGLEPTTNPDLKQRPSDV